MNKSVGNMRDIKAPSVDPSSPRTNSEINN